MTNFASLRQLVILTTLLAAHTASARYWTNDVIYVQAPAISGAGQANRLQPIIGPSYDPSTDQVQAVWPSNISYRMQTAAAEQFVQPNLNIGIRYNYYFNMELAARNANSKRVPLPDGYYQILFVVMRTDTHGKFRNPYERFVTYNSLFLEITDGKVDREVPLEFDEIGPTALENHLYIEIIPLSNDCEGRPCINLDKRGEPDNFNSKLVPMPGYKPYLVEVPFTPFQKRDAWQRNANDLEHKAKPYQDSSLAKYVAKSQNFRAKKILAASQRVSPEQYARDNHLGFVSLANNTQFAQSAGLLNDLIDSRDGGLIQITPKYHPLFQDLCQTLAKLNSGLQKQIKDVSLYGSRADFLRRVRQAIQQCADNPQQFMRLSKVTHVGEILDEKPVVRVERGLLYNLMANFAQSRSSAEDRVFGTSVGAGLPKIVSKFTEVLGINVAATNTVAWVNSRSTSDTGIGSVFNSLDLNYLVLEIPSKNSQQCLEVRVLPESKSIIRSTDPATKNGFYFCQPVSKETVTIREIYAHLFERCRETTLITCNSRSQLFNGVMRGDREVSATLYALRDGISPDRGNQIDPFIELASAQAYFDAVPVTGDMKVVTPIAFLKEKIPSFWQKISFQYRERFTNNK